MRDRLTRHIAPYDDVDGVPVPGPDRDEAAGHDLTRAQLLARRTRGVATLATALSASGAVLTGVGCTEIYKGNYAVGVGAVAIGAFCDMFDGMAARAMGVDGYKAGRYADAGLDGVKAAMIAGLGYATGAFPAEAMALTYSPKVAGWGSVAFSRFALKKELPTSKAGKIAEAVRWAAPAFFIGGYAASKLGLNPNVNVTDSLGWMASAVSAGLGVRAATGYLKSAFSSRNGESASTFVADPTDL